MSTGDRPPDSSTKDECKLVVSLTILVISHQKHYPGRRGCDLRYTFVKAFEVDPARCLQIKRRSQLHNCKHEAPPTLRRNDGLHFLKLLLALRESVLQIHLRNGLHAHIILCRTDEKWRRSGCCHLPYHSE